MTAISLLLDLVRRRLLPCLLLGLTVACNHSEPFNLGASRSPAGTGSDLLLTFNSQQDYWPTLTEDGPGILYAYIDASQYAAALFGHRCMGVMPVAGGQRYWEWCDNRAAEIDSVSSFPAFALGADGRLLYLEATTAARFPFALPNLVLWLADSAFPYRRRSLVTLPVTVGDSTISWLGDLRWTGPDQFIGLGQRFVVAGHCNLCTAVDSVFYGEMLVRGTIGAQGATLLPVAGTAGATSYSLAEDGASIVFTQRDNLNLLKVPAAGGVATAIPATTRPDVELLGVSCRGTTCVVALGPITLWQAAGPYGKIGSGAFELRSVSLSSGQSTTLLSRNGTVIASPLITSAGDVVAQLGRMFGHLQTFDSSQSDLHLYQALVP